MRMHFRDVQPFTHFSEPMLDTANLNPFMRSPQCYEQGRILIRPAIEKYHSEAGYLQEQEGPAEAEKLLREVGGFSEKQIARILYLVGHHHTYKDVEGIDYRILIEADFLVNLYESESRYRAILAAEKNVFETDTGKWILHEQFGIEF